MISRLKARILVGRLLPKLGLGIQGPAVDLARFAQRALDRSDSGRLCEAGLTTREALTNVDDGVLLRLLMNDAGNGVVRVSFPGCLLCSRCDSFA
jgi:hypothetical protein